MQEFWATATVHHHLIRFKMNNKKRIVNLEYFREMLHICPGIPNQTFDELPFEEEILAFLRYLGHSGEIKKIIDVNINKLHQPQRPFVVVISKCLIGKSTRYDSLKLSQAQILWGMYHEKNVDFAYLLWEDFVYQVEHKDAKKTYMEYYAIASGAAPPKTNASVRKTQSSFDTTIPPLTVAGTRLSTSAKRKQPAKLSKAKGLSVLFEVALTEAKQIKLATKRSLQQTHISQASGSGADERTGIVPGIPDVPIDESDEEISWKSCDEEDNDDVDNQSEADDDDDDQNEQDDDDQDDNDNDQDLNNDDDDFVHPKMSTHDEDDKDEESTRLSTSAKRKQPAKLSKAKGLSVLFEVALTEAKQIKLATKRSLQQTHISQASGSGADERTGIVPGIPDVPIDESDEEISWKSCDEEDNDDVDNQSEADDDDDDQNEQDDDDQDDNDNDQDLNNDDDDFVHPKMSTHDEDDKDEESFDPIVQTPSQVENSDDESNDDESHGMNVGFDHRLKTLEANFSEFMQTNQFTKDVSFILVTLKRCRDDADKDEEPSAGSDRGSKRRREGKEPESTSDPKEKASKTTSKSVEGSKSHQKTASESTPVEEPMQTTQNLEEPSHQEFKTGVANDQPIVEAFQHPESDLAKQANSRASFNELMDTPVDFLTFLINRLNVDTLTPKLLAGPTYVLMKGSCKSLVELEFFLEEVYKATTDQLDWNNPEG
nr:hypothetical protein [Tanacetum cinerariifolium]